MAKQREMLEQPRAMECQCVGMAFIEIKSPGLASGMNPPFLIPSEFHTRNSGAQFQDQRYGRGMRLHNPGYSKGKFKTLTCTVCGKVKAA